MWDFQLHSLMMGCHNDSFAGDSFQDSKNRNGPVNTQVEMASPKKKNMAGLSPVSGGL